MASQAREFAIELSYTGPDQQEIFEHPARYKIVRGGRRFGKTEGAATKGRDRVLNKSKYRVLWMDATNANVDRYANDLWMAKLPRELYKWNSQKKILRLINGSYVVFASADKPENAEGYSYDMVILNAAGILLLRRPRIWGQTILPMTVDNPACEILIVGTPRIGCYLFEQLSEKARTAEYGEDCKCCSGGTHLWKEFHRTTYDNPILTPEKIAEVEAEIPEELRPQEIYAEFVKENAGYITIPSGMVKAAVGRDVPMTKNVRPKWGVDVAGAGADKCAIAKRCANWLLAPVRSFRETDTMRVAAIVRDEYEETPDELKPSDIYIDGNGMGKGVYDRCVEFNLPARIVMVQARATNARFHRVRDELWFRARDWFSEKTSRIPNDKTLMHELSLPFYDPKWGNGVTKVESKKELKRRGASSPDHADAFNLTFAGGKDRSSPTKTSSRFKRKAEGSWMSAA